MKLWIAGWVLSLWMLAAPALRCGAELQAVHSDQLTVYWESQLEPVAKEIVAAYPRIRSSLLEVFGWKYDARSSVLLIGEREHFQHMAESPLTVAFAVPERQLMVIDTSRMSRNPFSMNNTVKHELCHLLLHHHIGKDRLPRWLDEGVCQWVSDGMADIVLEQKRSVLNGAALSGNFIPLDRLTAGFPRGSRDLPLAYEESKKFVSYLIREFGKEGVLKLLNRLKEGEAVEGAINGVFSRSLQDLELSWHASLKRRTGWFTYLSYHLYEILFSLMGVITVVAFVKAVLRKRRRLKEQEMEEEQTRG